MAGPKPCSAPHPIEGTEDGHPEPVPSHAVRATGGLLTRASFDQDQGAEAADLFTSDRVMSATWTRASPSGSAALGATPKSEQTSKSEYSPAIDGSRVFVKSSTKK